VRALSPLRLLGTPHDPNARPRQQPVSQTGASSRRRHSACASRYRRQIVSTQSILRAAATSGAIYQSISQPRHQHPHRGSPARRLEPALALRSEHRQHSIPIGHDPRSAASFNQASVQSRRPAALRRPCPDAGSRRTLNHSGDCDRPFRPKVITDSGDRDPRRDAADWVGVRSQRFAPSTRIQVA